MLRWKSNTLSLICLFGFCFSCCRWKQQKIFILIVKPAPNAKLNVRNFPIHRKGSIPWHIERLDLGFNTGTRTPWLHWNQITDASKEASLGHSHNQTELPHGLLAFLQNNQNYEQVTKMMKIIPAGFQSKTFLYLGTSSFHQSRRRNISRSLSTVEHGIRPLRLFGCLWWYIHRTHENDHGVSCRLVVDGKWPLFGFDGSSESPESPLAFKTSSTQGGLPQTSA